MNTEGFFKLILPPEGYFCAVIFAGDKVIHRFVDTHAQLAEVVLQADAAGHTVYHACASYIDKRLGRRKENVRAIKSLWLDIDLTKKVDGDIVQVYEDERAATKAIITFARDEKLPVPLIVYSGGGLQTYWPFNQELTATEWLGYAQGLRSKLRSRQIEFDAARTCDAASILRPIGTHNYKRQGKLVGANLEGKSPSNAALFQSLRVEIEPKKPAYSFGPLPDHLRNVQPLAREVWNDYQDSSGAQVADLCGQLRHFRDARGCLPEPLWFAGLSVLAYCRDGDALGHEWSAGDDRYRHDHTQSRLDRARNEADGPATCERFIGLDPKRCDGCPYRDKITSPIQLGRASLHVRPVETHAASVRGSNGDSVVSELAGGNTTGLNGFHHEAAKSDDPIAFPDGFGLDEFGRLVKIGEIQWRGGAPSQDPPTMITAQPFYLQAIQVGQGGRNYVFANKLKAGWENFTMPAETLMGMSGVSKMAAHVMIHSKEAFIDYVKKATDLLVNKADPENMHETNGWVKTEPRTFVVGDRVYRDGGDYQAAISQEMRDYARELRPKGDFETWRSAAHLFLSKKIMPHAFAVLTSFAAPLMVFEAPDEGGTILSLVHQDTGTGKTTSLQCGCSVWGRWHFMNATNVDTFFSRMKKMGMLNNLPAFYDEIVTADAEQMRTIVNTFTLGKDRERLTSDAKLQRLPYTWATVLGTSSNKSLVDQVNRVSQNALAARILEFEVGEKLEPPPQGMDYFKDVFGTNYGWAGHKYLRFITRPEVFGKVMEILKRNAKSIEQDNKLPTGARFYKRILTASMTAATIVKHMGLLNIDFEEVAHWAIKEAIRSSTVIKGRMGKAEMDAASTELLGHYIAAHMQNFLIVDGSGPGTRNVRVVKEPRGEVVGRWEEDTKMLTVGARHFADWVVENNYNIKENLAKLKRINVLTGNRICNLTARTDFPAVRLPAFIFDVAHIKGD